MKRAQELVLPKSLEPMSMQMNTQLRGLMVGENSPGAVVEAGTCLLT